MALREDDQPWAGIRCAACGGPPDDSSVRKMMGCNGPLKNGKTHEIATRRGLFTTNECPRKQLRAVSPYFKAYKWWDKGQLHLCYPEGVPARIADGIEFIGATLAAIQDEKCLKK